MKVKHLKLALSLLGLALVLLSVITIATGVGVVWMTWSTLFLGLASLYGAGMTKIDTRQNVRFWGTCLLSLGIVFNWLIGFSYDASLALVSWNAIFSIAGFALTAANLPGKKSKEETKHLEERRAV